MITTESPKPDRAAKHRQKLVEYVTWIDRTCSENPGARVALRAGLRQNINNRSTFAMNRYIAPWLPENASDATQRAYFTVAALIASRPRAAENEDDEDENEDGAPDGASAERSDNGVQRPESGPDSTDAPAGDEAEPAVPAEAPERWGPSLGSAFAEAVAEAPGRDREMRESAAESRLNMLTRQGASGIHRSLPASVLYLRQLDVPVDWAQLLADLIAWPDHSGRIARRWLQDYYRRRHRDANQAGGDEGSTPDSTEESPE
ncbi:type I-E CRISPR-associated protein Cse2/CasB [Streptomyces profundus]|uniref:type I-E CRISPR-associated protein Cse2/CasB n=1 Tax=Streptomyces profundus TaxID=2867410 RepID=UPI001D16AD77|nr:type I-E CRISPR-associated protein Cse2/CasB [Streptomyces sp. MA3_2.13]UED84716.1 type I-E CRISPR-associated protein Cse2/CasB [Streptomyces sp. MA3_2.13]